MANERATKMLRKATSSAAVAAMTVMSFTGVAGAITPDATTDYETYPSSLPAGCADGADALVGLAFSNEAGDTSADLRKLSVSAGETITMNWTGYSEGCADETGAPLVGVALAAYATEGSTFDINSDEQLIPGHAYCGPEGDACVGDADGFSLSLAAPTMDQSCFFQLDAVLDTPLAVVGPNGSYYSSVLRNDDGANKLISAKNAGKACEEAEVASAPAAKVLPVTKAAEAQALPVTKSAALSAAPQAAEVLSEVLEAPVVPTAEQPLLAITGADSSDLAGISAVMVAMGGGLLLVSDRMKKTALSS